MFWYSTMWSGCIIIVILYVKHICLAEVLDAKKCLKYEDLVTEAPLEVEDIENVVFDKNTKSITRVKYGQHVRLICDVELNSSVKIEWHVTGNLLTNSLSNDSKELDIKSVTEEYHGEYITCEAIVNSKVENVFGTNLIIRDLAPPLISEQTVNNVTLMEHNNKTLTCKITKGTPKPTMKWQIKRNGDNDFQDLSASGEEFTIDDANLQDDGQYKCIATNMKGKESKTIVVTVQRIPVVNIEEGSKMVLDYGSTAEFTCNISGYPLPKATWTDIEGNELHSKEYSINRHEQIRKLVLQNMKKSNNYSCSAESSLGTAHRSINVMVLSPFVVYKKPEDTTNVHYAASTDIICNISSSFPMIMKWFGPRTDNSSEQTQIHTDKSYSITNGALQIKSVVLGMVGKYTCVASLLSDENEKISFTTDVQIDDLAPPLASEISKITVLEDSWITLSCHIIGGVPSPTLRWQVMRHGDTTFKDLTPTTEELDIENITITYAGKYRCVAENNIGVWTKVTEVLVRKAPETVIEEGAVVSVAYGSNNTFTCRVTGYPLQSVAWKDSSGALLTAKETRIHEHEITSTLAVETIRVGNIYSCHASNLLGTNDSSINVTVRSPFIIHQKPEYITNVHYTASTDLVCNIESSFPLTIKWYHNSTEVVKNSKYTISANETVLHINTIDLDDVGNYKCEAILISDDKQKEEFTTDVKIDDLRSPVITYYSGPLVSVKNLEDLTLVCKASGNPPPVVTWQFQDPRTGIRSIGEGETMSTTHAGSTQQGKYVCTASNIVGEDVRETNVKVN